MDYILIYKETDEPVRFAYSKEIIIYGDIEEAQEDCDNTMYVLPFDRASEGIKAEIDEQLKSTDR